MSDAADAGTDLVARTRELEAALRGTLAASSERETQLLLLLVGLLDGFHRLDRAIPLDSLGEESRRIHERYSLIRKRLEVALEREGVVRIDSLGLEPNPELHEASDKRAAEGAATGTIIEVDEEGYLYRGGLLRRAKVVVAD